MNQVNYRDTLLRRWWIVVVAGLVGLLIGLAVPVGHSSATGSKWKTTAVVGTVPASGYGSKGAVGTGVGFVQLTFYARSAQVMQAAASQVGLPPSTHVESIFSVTLPTAKGGQQGLVELNAVGHTPAQSAALTNAFATQLGQYLTILVKSQQQAPLQAAQQRVATLNAKVQALGAKAPPALQNQLTAAEAQEQALATSASYTGYSVLQPADAATAKRVTGKSSVLGSSHVTVGLIGLVVGALLGAGIALLIESLDRSLKTAARAEEGFGFRVVAEIPAPARGESAADMPVLQGVVRPSAPGTAAAVRAEAYQRLRMSVLLEGLETQPEVRPSTRQVVLVVSAANEPTRSTVVDNLAAVCADAGQRVIVVNTHDLRSGDDGGDTGFPATMTPAVLARQVQRSRLEHVALLSLGQVIGSSGQLLARAPSVMAAARQLCDMVIIEAPPLLAFHDGNALSACSDVVLVVGECGTTGFDQAERAGELLRRIDAPVLGVVLTNVHINSRDLRQAKRDQVGVSRNLAPDPVPSPRSAPVGTPTSSGAPS